MTQYFFLDASAWAKRYYREPGSDVVNLLLDRLLPAQPLRLVISRLGFTETASVLNRRHNAGQLTARLFQQALAQLAEEAAQVQTLPTSDEIIDRSLSLLLRHNLNASDTLYLQQILDWQAQFGPAGNQIALIATDQRLLRAADREGIASLNPETADLTMVEMLLNGQ